jgi:hypothetical protein
VFDSEYFRTTLQSDVDAVGGSAVVELQMVNGRTHSLRAVLSVHSGYATFEAFRARGDQPLRELRWKEAPRDGEPAAETYRAIVAYDGIAAVTVTPATPAGAAKIGFARA